MPTLTPVDYDPFAQAQTPNAPASSGGVSLTPVDYDPFAQQSDQQQETRPAPLSQFSAADYEPPPDNRPWGQKLMGAGGELMGLAAGAFNPMNPAMAREGFNEPLRALGLPEIPKPDLPDTLHDAGSAILSGEEYWHDPRDNRRVVGAREGFARRVGQDLFDMTVGAITAPGTPIDSARELLNAGLRFVGATEIPSPSAAMDDALGINPETERFASPRSEFMAHGGADVLTSFVPIGGAEKSLVSEENSAIRTIRETANPVKSDNLSKALTHTDPAASEGSQLADIITSHSEESSRAQPSRFKTDIPEQSVARSSDTGLAETAQEVTPHEPGSGETPIASAGEAERSASDAGSPVPTNEAGSAERSAQARVDDQSITSPVIEQGTATEPVLGRAVQRDQQIAELKAKRGTEGLTADEANALHDLRDAADEQARVAHTGEPIEGVLNKQGQERKLASGEIPSTRMALDIDEFKSINDKNGYSMGNAVIKSFGEKLAESHPGVTAVHLGGDEFVLHGTPEHLAQAREAVQQTLATHRIEAVDQGKVIGSYDKPIKFSAGIGHDNLSAEAALKTDKAAREARGERTSRAELDRRNAVSVGGPNQGRAPERLLAADAPGVAHAETLRSDQGLTATAGRAVEEGQAGGSGNVQQNTQAGGARIDIPPRSPAIPTQETLRNRNGIARAERASTERSGPPSGDSGAGIPRDESIPTSGGTAPAVANTAGEDGQITLGGGQGHPAGIPGDGTNPARINGRNSESLGETPAGDHSVSSTGVGGSGTQGAGESEGGGGNGSGSSRITPPSPEHWIPKASQEITAAAKDWANEIVRAVSPMADAHASSMARALSTRFANQRRLNQWVYSRRDLELVRQFSPQQLKEMWIAGDEESVNLQRGGHVSGEGYDRLKPAELAALQRLQKESNAAFSEAQNIGLVEGNVDGLPSYVTRMVYGMSKEFTGSSGGKGGVTTGSPFLKARKHETAAETEAAAKAKGGDQAVLLRNIRVLPLSTLKLNQAISGRALINAIQESGRAEGVNLVQHGTSPGTDWFTMDHPAFTTYKMLFTKEDGKVVPRIDQNDMPVFTRVPIYIHKSWEGPLKAVMSERSGSIYKALMDTKARAMSITMLSPVIHNAVEFGRALPAAPFKTISFAVYRDGARALGDEALIKQAATDGLVPIGIGHGGMNAAYDQSELLPDAIPKAGRSLTAQAVALPARLLGAKAAEVTKRAVDKVGDFVHGTLLWNQVAKLQMGLYTHFRQSLVAGGMPEGIAGPAAAHWANRYAGAIANEATSNAVRKASNLLMFSRSFTTGNVAVGKDVLNGFPQNIKDLMAINMTKKPIPTKADMAAAAKLVQDSGVAAKGRWKAGRIIPLDIVAGVVTTALFSSLVTIARKGANQSPTSSPEFSSYPEATQAVLRGYNDRFWRMAENFKEAPWQSMVHWYDTLNSLSPASENEPGKQDRVQWATLPNGTNLYMKNPIGKIGEEYMNWGTKPVDTAKAKLSPLAKTVYETAANDKGFGRHVYNPNPKGYEDMLKIVGDMVMNAVEKHLPEMQIEGVKNLMEGTGNKTVNTARVIAPFAGFTVSQGYPGGKEAALKHQASDEKRQATLNAKPSWIKLIQQGRMEEARSQMTAANVSPRIQSQYIQQAQNAMEN